MLSPAARPVLDRDRAGPRRRVGLPGPPPVRLEQRQDRLVQLGQLLGGEQQQRVAEQAARTTRRGSSAGAPQPVPGPLHVPDRSAPRPAPARPPAPPARLAARPRPHAGLGTAPHPLARVAPARRLLDQAELRQRPQVVAGRARRQPDDLGALGGGRTALRLLRYSMIASRAGWASARITCGSLIVIRRGSGRASVIGPMIPAGPRNLPSPPQSRAADHAVSGVERTCRSVGHDGQSVFHPLINTEPESVVHQFYCGFMLEALEQVGGAVDDCAETALWGSPMTSCLLLSTRLRCWRSGWPPFSSAWSASWTVRGLGGRPGRLVHRSLAAGAAPALRSRRAPAGPARRHHRRRPASGARRPAQRRHHRRAGSGGGRDDRRPPGARPVPKWRTRPLQLLVAWADRFDPTSLSRLGERVLTHVAPELADEAELKALERATERAEARRHVTLSEQQNGQVRLSGNLDTETASLLREAIDPLCAPAGEHDDRSPGQRRADALGEICRLALRTGQLPDNGGDRPQLVVTVSLDELVNGVRAGTLETGTRLTPGAVRRLACDAGVLPAVLGRQQSGPGRRSPAPALHRPAAARAGPAGRRLRLSWL